MKKEIIIASIITFIASYPFAIFFLYDLDVTWYDIEGGTIGGREYPLDEDYQTENSKDTAIESVIFVNELGVPVLDETQGFPIYLR